MDSISGPNLQHTILPSRMWVSFRAISTIDGSANVTKPKPLGWPVLRFFMMTESMISPYFLKWRVSISGKGMWRYKWGKLTRSTKRKINAKRQKQEHTCSCIPCQSTNKNFAPEYKKKKLLCSRQDLYWPILQWHVHNVIPRNMCLVETETQC